MSVDHPAYAIVGATGGIGSELCRLLAQRGAKLFLGGRDEAAVDDQRRRRVAMEAAEAEDDLARFGGHGTPG